MHFERIIHSICADFAPQRLLFFRHYTMPCTRQSKRRACALRTWLQFAIERKNKRSRNFNSGVSFGFGEASKCTRFPILFLTRMKRYGNKFKFKSVVFIFISWPKIVNRGKKISNWIFFPSVEKFTKVAVVSCFGRDIQKKNKCIQLFFVVDIN